MSFVSEQQLEQTVTRIQREMNDKLQTELVRINGALNQARATTTGGGTSPTRPGMNNMTRNGDHRHSVNTYYAESPASDDTIHECANVYAYQPLDAIAVSDANIADGSSAVSCPVSAPFTAAMNGRFMIIEGAGDDGASLSGIITYVSPTSATLSVAAETSVSNAKARLNLQKFTHKNTLNAPGVSVNDALKSSAHSQVSANIQDPDWDENNGIARIGGKNVVAYPFGYFTDDGLTYVPLHQLFSGRVVFTRFNIARAHRFVKVKGRLFVGIYNNNERVLDWVKGSKFQVTATVSGNPATTSTAEYLVVIETGSGFSIVSDILTVENAPDEAAFNAGARVRLNWARFAGAINTKIYRRLSGGNVFKLEEDSIDREYLDTNNPTKQDIGASFPAIANAQDTIASYFATPENGLDELPDTSVGEAYQPVEIFLPFAPSVNMAQLFDPHLILGLTEPLATEITDAQADGAGNISSSSSIFTAAMVGKAYTLRHQESNQTASGTVTGFADVNHITLSSSPFAATGCILEIEDSQPHGLVYDLVGTALTETSSEWDFHADDNNRKQNGRANPPEGSNQGGIGGSDGYGGGTGGLRCVLDSVKISVKGKHHILARILIFVMNFFGFGKNLFARPKIAKKRADRVLPSDLLWNGTGFEDADFNEIEWIKSHSANEITLVTAGKYKLQCTQTHRLVTGTETRAAGVAVSQMMVGNKTLISTANSSNLEEISAMPRVAGNFQVTSFGLKEKATNTCHLMVCNDFVSHNQKEAESPELNIPVS